MKEKRNFKKSGISLIVLVITIIVIIILAVAVILSIANNNPISNANKARAANDESALLEAANLAYTSLYADKQIKGEAIDYDSLTDEVRNSLLAQGFSDEKVNQVIVSEKGVELSNERIISKELQGSYILANNVYSKEHDVEVKLSSSTITDFSTIKVKQFGTNLFDYNTLSKSDYIKVQSYENGVITLVNNSTTATKQADFIIEQLPAGTYTLSHSDDKTIHCYTGSIDNWSASVAWNTNEKQLTLTKSCSLKLSVFVGANATVEIKNLQVQLGDKKTDYAEYVCNKFTPNSDGTVSGVKSISPYMTFITDNDNVSITCKYKKIAEEVTTSKIKGKKMAVIGDSISAGVSSVRLSSGKITPATTGRKSFNKCRCCLVATCKE